MSALPRPDYSNWGTQPNTPSVHTPDPDGASAASKKKRAKSNVVYSQPADTGTGSNVNTQLFYALDHLKSTHNPMRLQDIAIMTNTPLDSDPILLEKFKSHERVQYDPKTDLYSYKHNYNFHSKAELLTEIQRAAKKGSGVSVRVLKESWKDAPTAIDELEKEGEVLVTRTAKDGQLRMVFWNEVKPGEDSGGMQVEKEFFDMWNSLKVPNDVDLYRALEAEGLQATAGQALPPKAPTAKKKGKKAAQRQRPVRLTNTHLKEEIDLTKDYVATTK